MSRVAIIPARGGSKRIPRKNVTKFCGKPMIAWSIEAAKASGCFDKIIVSTDDHDIADVAEQWGAEAPFLRPSDLADDYTGTLPVIRHAVQWLTNHEVKVDYACCVYATAPFVTSKDLLRGWELIHQSGASFVFSVTSYAFPIQRAIRITENGRVAMFNPEHSQTRSQDLEEAWHDAGQFYWGTADAWLEEKPIFGEDSLPVKLPRHRVQDIDTSEDWTRAEWLFKAMRAETETQ
ncbi:MULTISPECIES: pseudaminic acid cytidylyltransferase [unclassified Halomonas]|uniref:pseudaminic acid cytidylyltransferase n=1 Tax=unclassified Halomonas TaxID=2609666 RepID=UPI0007D9484C|nr:MULTISPECIES: pseudaminic acid cytidylyltransferase [unclassified Halomonas]MBT2786011.1 pseudaminic acid cytidylyltransferase [Halomonas sp. ISL-106]MBT2797033.1 pseudaminic acid cytidylyltransferase [Halomonas sp. ISL-104]OAL58420.1 pseudaminic acid cytidylyltransferase [Halomonas sp. ALS9]